MAIRGNRRPRTIPFSKLDKLPHNYNLPVYAKIREIDFQTRGKELWFFFSRWSKDIYLPDHGPIKDLIDRVSGKDFRFDYDSASYPREEEEYSSPLSLRNERLSYIIYRLSDRSWQFARNGYPVTMGAKGRKFYFDGYRVSGSGYFGKDPGTEFDPDGPVRDHCNTVFFIADGKEARKDNGNADKYAHPINLHVDLIFDGSPPLYMPIMIDPDIRYPGGSGSE